MYKKKLCGELDKLQFHVRSTIYESRVNFYEHFKCQIKRRRNIKFISVGHFNNCSSHVTATDTDIFINNLHTYKLQLIPQNI